MRGPALLPMLCAAAIAATAFLQAQPQAFAQANTAPPQGVSRGENFSAKPAPALFASDCTGGGCHRGPQGLAKGRGQTGLAGFLREHYTNSRESAASLANYLMGVPSGPAPGDARTSTRQPSQTPPGRGSRAAARPDDETPSAPQRRGAEPAEPPKPAPPARAAARPDDEPPQATPSGRRTAEPAQTPPKPSARDRRGRQTTAAPAAAEPAPPPPAPPPPQQFDIFD
jgi:hypothetical protein